MGRSKKKLIQTSNNSINRSPRGAINCEISRIASISRCFLSSLETPQYGVISPTILSAKSCTSATEINNNINMPLKVQNKVNKKTLKEFLCIYPIPCIWCDPNCFAHPKGMSLGSFDTCDRQLFHNYPHPVIPIQFASDAIDFGEKKIKSFSLFEISQQPKIHLKEIFIWLLKVKMALSGFKRGVKSDEW